MRRAWLLLLATPSLLLYRFLPGQCGRDYRRRVDAMLDEVDESERKPKP